jgi:hypothetical protein
MHMSCQPKKCLSKQSPEPATAEWGCRANALNVRFVATRGTRMRPRPRLPRRGKPRHDTNRLIPRPGGVNRHVEARPNHEEIAP